MDTKATALELLRLAAAIFPPLAELLASLLRDRSRDEPLADEIRRILPAEGASAAARRKLEGEG